MRDEGRNQSLPELWLSRPLHLPNLGAKRRHDATVVFAKHNCGVETSQGVQSTLAMVEGGVQPFAVQSCVPLIATGTMGPRPLWSDGFITIIGVSHEVHPSFLPTSTVVRGPRPLCHAGLVSVTDTRRASVQARRACL